MNSIRRIVTGHDENGASVVISDGIVPVTFEHPYWPGFKNTAVWASDTMPPDNMGALPSADEKLLPFPGPRGTVVGLVEIPPERDLEAMSPEQRAKAETPVVQFGVPGLIEVDIRKHFGMHATDTLDYFVLLDGELTMILDTEEVILRPHDVVIQRGGNHAWKNHGSRRALAVVFIITAEKIPPGVRRGSPV
jgi:mannose-6-phosphate isomerase-like protein (cupin superfamily)